MSLYLHADWYSSVTSWTVRKSKICQACKVFLRSCCSVIVQLSLSQCN